jgi:hypothetical protein
VRFFNEGIAALGSSLYRGGIAAQRCSFRAGHGEAESQRKGYSQKKITHGYLLKLMKGGVDAGSGQAACVVSLSHACAAKPHCDVSQVTHLTAAINASASVIRRRNNIRVHAIFVTFG